MKKLLFSIALFTGLNASAQLPDGSTCPDFTATDINGVSHNLYSYLNAGKTVIIDVSATWCGPCWAFHNAHVLADMYNSYGQGGSGEVVVLFVEGDDDTNDADLHGTGANTQGDWVTGTPYPIIDNGGVANTLQIGYFPTLYRICPNKIVTNISPSEPGGATSVASLKTLVESGCATTLVGTQNNAKVEAESIVTCDNTGSPMVKIVNNGGNAITAATVIIKENGTQVATTNFTGNIATFEEGTVTFPAMTINSGSTYTAEITSVNSATPFSAISTVTDLSVISSAQGTGVAYTINITTDNYGTETTWELKNAAGTVVSSGGPYTDASVTQPAVPVTLDPNACYVFTIFDSYGDGMDSGFGVGSYSIKDANNTVVLSGGSFASAETKGMKSGTAPGAGLNDLSVNDLSVYPNPSNGSFVINSKDLKQFSNVDLIDQSGRVLASWEINATTMNVEATGIANGNYTLIFKGDNGKAAHKIQINK